MKYFNKIIKLIEKDNYNELQLIESKILINEDVLSTLQKIGSWIFKIFKKFLNFFQKGGTPGKDLENTDYITYMKSIMKDWNENFSTDKDNLNMEMKLNLNLDLPINTAEKDKSGNPIPKAFEFKISNLNKEKILQIFKE